MRTSFIVGACLVLLCSDVIVKMSADAFGMSIIPCRTYCSSRQLAVEGEGIVIPVNPDDYDLLPPDDVTTGGNVIDHQIDETRRTELKRQLYQLAASFDRGFGATPKARSEADEIIKMLGALNPTKYSARGIDGDSNDDSKMLDDNTEGALVPLKAIWRMVWTSAFDVVSLGASPFAGEHSTRYFT